MKTLFLYKTDNVPNGRTRTHMPLLCLEILAPLDIFCFYSNLIKSFQDTIFWIN